MDVAASAETVGDPAAAVRVSIMARAGDGVNIRQQRPRCRRADWVNKNGPRGAVAMLVLLRRLELRTY